MATSHTLPTIAVVIPVHNNANTIGDQLLMLSQQTYRGTFHVVVVDNLSTDDTAARAREWIGLVPHLVVISADRQPGANYARNVGANFAITNYNPTHLLFCDGDDMVTPSWIACMEYGLRLAHLVGGYTDYTKLNDPVIVAKRWAPAKSKPYKLLGFLPYASCATLGVHTVAYKAVLGFNPDYRYGGTDVEFSWRVQLAGFDYRYEPLVRVNYRLRPTTTTRFRQAFYYGKSDYKLYRDFRNRGCSRPKFALWKLIRPLPDPMRVYRLGSTLGRLAGALGWE